MEQRRLTQDALRDGETASRLIVDRIPGIVLFMTPTGELEFVNQPVRTYFGKTLEQLKHWWTDDTVHADDRAHAFDVFTRATASGEPYKFEARFRRHDGVYRWFQCRGVPHRDEAGGIVRWYAMGNDIEDRKRSETLLAGEKQLLEMVASDQPTSTVLAALCRHVETVASGSCCSIVLVDPNGTKLHEAIAPSLPAEFNEAVRGWPLDRLGGPCQAAARDKVQIIMSDVASDIRWRTSWRALAQKHGLVSCWSTPISSRDGEVLGTFALYQREPGTPTASQLDVIRQYTHIASIAIERARRDAALRQSEARRATAERDLQLMIDTIPVFVAAYEPDGARSFVNQTWQQYMGLTAAEATGPNARKTFPHFHPEDAARIDRAWRASLASGEPLLTEARVRRADGEYRWHTSHRVPLRDEQGKIIRWYSIGVDIDNQKSAEDRLRRSEARLAEAERELQLTIDTIPMLVATYRPDGSRFFVNQTWRDYLGLRPDDAVDAFRTAVVHPEDAARVLEEWQKCLTSELPFSAEMRLRRADGVYRWHTVHRVLARDEAGAVIKWYSVGVDIDEQKRSEERLRRSEAQLAEAERDLQLTIDTIPTLVTAYRPDGSRIFVNRSFTDYSGVSLEEAQRTRWSLVHPDDTDRVEREWRICQAGETPFKTEVRLRRADGEYRWHVIHRVFARDTDGAITKWYSTAVDIEDRKRAEEKLRESEYNSRLIADTIPGLVIVFTPDGNFEGVNRQTIEYFGKTLDDVTSKRWSTRDAIHPDDYPRCTELFKQSIASGEPFEFELRFRRSDGVYRWFQSRGLPLRDANGRIVRWYNLLIDIDERKRAEGALRQSEARLVDAERELQLTIDTIPTLVTAYRPDGSRVFVNRSWQQYSGISREEAFGPTRWSMVHPDDMERVDKEWEISQATETPSKSEVRLRRADGEYRWHVIHRVFERDVAGRIVKWYSAALDIEDRKRAEDARRHSEAELADAKRELERTIDTMPAMLGRLGADGKLDFVNQTYRDYTGLTTQQAVEGTRKDFHPDDAETVAAAWRTSLASGTPLQIDLRLRRSDGAYRWHTLRRIPVRDEKGTIVKWYGVASDIDERKRAEEALRQSEARLAEAQRELQITIDSIPAMVAVYEPDGTRIFVNQQWQHYTNRSQHEATGAGRRLMRQFHPDESDDVEHAFWNSLSTGEPLALDLRIRRADGEYRWHAHQSVPLRDKQGKIVKWYAIDYDIEDKKRAESDLLDSEARLAETERDLRIMLDSIPTITWRAGANGYVQYLNKRWFEYTGTTTEQVRGWRWKLCVHPEDLDQLVAAGDKYVTSGEPIDSEARLRRFDGEYRWFLFRPAPVRDEAGKVVAWYGTITDIEDRKQAEQKALEAEREVQRTIDNIPVLVATYSPDGLRLSVNKWALEVTGLSAEDVPDERWRKAFHPDELEAIDTQWRECVAQGEPFEREIRMRMTDGLYRAHLTRRLPLRDEAGRVIRWYGIAYDIEDQRRAEAELRRSETILAEGQRVSSTGSFSWCVDTNELVFSEELLRIFEFDPNTPLTFEEVFSRIHPEDAPALSARMKLIRSGRAAGEQELRLQMPDGRIKYLLSVGHMMQQPNGHVEYLGAIQDVTQRRVAEQGLDKVRSELAHVTRVMSLGALTASIAHEVNQPLAGIITNASTCLRMLAADPPNVDGARETARRTIRDGNRAADVISRLRALFGKKGTTTETLDLNEATREVVALVFSDLLRNRVIVRVELDDEPLLVTGDRVQLQQVILNLVRNASDAMSEVNDRPRNLLVKAGREPDGNTRLTVSDAGVGLHPQTAERLFDAFYTSKSDGMGIGLSVSRSIIESHGGRIWAEPNEGPGATFSFSIPPQATSAEDGGAAGAILPRPTRGAHDRTRNA